jgi:UDP-N-acetylglucosamine 4,6-dehydratase
MMAGGEIFVPKIATMRIVDLAKAIAPDAELRNVGIRPGEKLHELLIPRDEARNTLDCDNLYVIQPAMQQWTAPGTQTAAHPGKPVGEDFEYASDSAPERLDGAALRAIIQRELPGQG